MEDSEKQARKRLWERDRAIVAVEAALARARAGLGSALFIVGEAGLGKTSVLELARERAGIDFEVGFGRGEEMEATFPFGLASQALSPFHDGLVGDGAAVVEPSAPFHRALRWLEDRPGRPFLVALDDLHWADPDSLNLFAFLVRRLEGFPIALIATLRPWPPAALEVCRTLADSSTATYENLEPLGRASADELLSHSVDQQLSDTTCDRAWQLCRGNPLLVEQVATVIRRRERLPETDAAGRGMGQHLLLSRFAGLDEVSTRCARSASVCGATFRPWLAAAAAELSEDEADHALEALYRSGLVTADSGELMRFTHPLLAAALYDDLAPHVRVRLHRRLFEILAARGLDDEAAEHAVRADLVGNQDAAALLGRTGSSSLAAGAVATAVKQLDAAVRFDTHFENPRLLPTLAEALIGSGRAADADRVCADALRELELSEKERIDVLRMRGRALYLAGAPGHGEDVLEEAVEIAAASDPALAVQPLLDLSLSAWIGEGPRAALPLAARARKLARDADAELRERADAVWGHIALESGDPAGAAATAAVEWRFADDAPADALAPAELTWPWAGANQFAMNETYLERYESAQRAWAKIRAAVGRAGAVNATANVAVQMGHAANRRGRLREALDEATRAEEFSDLTPQVLPYAHLVRAEALLWLGEFDQSETQCMRAEETAAGQWFSQIWLAHLRGARLLWDGDVGASDALLVAEQVTLRVGARNPGLVHWGAHAVAAHIAAGRESDAVRVVEWLEGAHGIPGRWHAFAAALGRGWLAEAAGDGSAADVAFRRALGQLEGVELPLQRVEGLIAYGGFLRRHQGPLQARPHLAEAVRLAEASDALWLARTAHEELKLAGGRRRRRDEDRDRLTEAEHRVAERAAAGDTNAEIARRLHLSINTVQTHLKRVYAKLEIGSRRELRTLDLDDDGSSA